MNATITKSGLKIFNEEKHVKTIPSKYEPVWNSVQLNLTKKRLLPNERGDLELKLFEAELKKTEPLVYEQIKDATPLFVQEVNNHGAMRYELMYDNDRRVRITNELYKLWEEKMPMKYCNY